MRIVLERDAITPTRAHDTDAGLDLYAVEGGIIFPHEGRTFRTGVHVEVPEGCAGLLVSKSGLNTKSDITSTGLIDEGYTGEIMVKLYNHGTQSRTIKRGDKITQLVIVPVRYEGIEIVPEISGGERGADGFGSTGR